MLGLIPLIVVALLDGLNRPSDLANAVAELKPWAPKYMGHDEALPHVYAAIAVETKEIPAELLLSIAYSESRYDPNATSYLLHGKRVANVPRWARAAKPPKGVTGPYFCGVTQVAAKLSWKRCQEVRDIDTAYRVAVGEVAAWLKACRKHKKDRMRCALFGYGGGFPAIERATSTYPARVMKRARRILNKTLEARKNRLGSGKVTI